MTDTPQHLVRCASHRARKRLSSVVGPKAQGYWHPGKSNPYGVYGVDDDQLPRARKIKGVSKVRGAPDEWLRCWS